MQKIILFSIFAMVVSAHAQIQNNIDRLNGHPRSQQFCPNCFLAATEENLMKSCVEKICPNKDFSSEILLNRAYQRSSKTDTSYDKEIKPLIKELVTEEAVNKVAQVDFLKQWISENPKVSEPAQIRAYNLFVSIGDKNKFEYKTVNGKIVVDERASRERFPGVNDKEFRARAQRVNVLNEFQGDLLFPELDPSKIKMNQGENFSQKAEKIISGFEENLKALNADPELKFLTDLKEIQYLLSAGDLKTQLKDSLSINSNVAKRLTQMQVIHNWFLALSNNPRFKQAFTSDAIEINSQIKKNDRLSVLENQKKLAAPYATGTLEIQSDACRVAFDIAQEVLPTQIELKSFRDQTEKIKESFSTATKDMLCAADKNSYLKAVKSWKAHLPLTKDQFLPNLKASINRLKAETSQYHTWNQQAQSSPHKNAIFAINLAGLPPMKNITDRVDELCRSMTPEILPDSASLINPGFVTGPLVVKLKNAEAVSYHELGHKLFQFIEKDSSCVDQEKFARMKACLASNHKEFNPSRFEQEDFSDLVAAKTGGKADNLACVFARKSNEADYAKMSLRAFDGAEHSSDLFRLLHINYIKTGKTPEQCAAALRARGETFSIQNCLPSR